MRMSRLFGRTLREAPADAEVASHALLLRAGFIRPLGAGIFSYLPLARRALDRIETILRDEIEAIGGQEITMPVVHPADLWKETGRWFSIGSEMGRFRDGGGRDMALAMTHEEVVGDLVRSEIHSYRQLPALVYQIQTKWRDELRSRGGLIRVREFTMKDSYSLDVDEAGLDAQYEAHYAAYFNIFGRCGLDTVAVESDVGMMGGSRAHEYMYLTPIGEDTLLLCDGCGYTANRQVAGFDKTVPETEDLLDLEEVETPDSHTIAAVAEFLGVPTTKTAKAVFMVATIADGEEETERLVFAVIRGDMDVNETKLTNAVGAKTLRTAHPDEIRAIGASPGYGSPVGVKGALIVVDDSVANAPNLVAGANRDGYHYLNTNCGRDYEPDIVADIAAAGEGDACPTCGAPMRTSRGVEVGNIFKLGTRYSEALGCNFLGRDGKAKPVVMGSYGIGVGRLLACVAEEHRDENGFIWPITVAPYPVHIVALGAAKETADRLHDDLAAIGIECLYDDRDESAGVKFNDADLIGLPIRLTVAKRALEQGGVELKLRTSDEKILVPLDQLPEKLMEEIHDLERSVASRVAERASG
jgi:prolyl-tRNA synthetase